MFNVYLICAEFDGKRLYKIGYTRRSVEKRIKEFKTGNGSDIYLIDSFKSKWGTKIESSLHRKYKENRISGEWFYLSDQDIKEFKHICELYHKNFEIISNENLYFLEKGKF